MCEGNSKVILNYGGFLVLKSYIACDSEVIYNGNMRLKKEHAFL